MSEESTVPVSLKAPFLSNLNVLSNIILVKDVKKLFTQKSCEDEALEWLEKLDLTGMAYSHHTTLSNHKRFYAQLIRAVMSECENIVIDQPYLMVPSQKDVVFIRDVATNLGINLEKIIIVDQITNEYKYSEELCTIKKWS